MLGKSGLQISRRGGVDLGLSFSPPSLLLLSARRAALDLTFASRIVSCFFLISSWRLFLTLLSPCTVFTAEGTTLPT